MHERLYQSIYCSDCNVCSYLVPVRVCDMELEPVRVDAGRTVCLCVDVFHDFMFLNLRVWYEQMNAFTQPVKPAWLDDLKKRELKKRGGNAAAKKFKGQVVYGLNNKPENSPYAGIKTNP